MTNDKAYSLNVSELLTLAFLDRQLERVVIKGEVHNVNGKAVSYTLGMKDNSDYSITLTGDLSDAWHAMWSSYPDSFKAKKG